MSPGIRDFLISEEVYIPPRIPTKTNNKRKYRLLLVIKVPAEAENEIITIKLAVQPASKI